MEALEGLQCILMMNQLARQADVRRNVPQVPPFMQMRSRLNNVSIILVGTKSAANIGATARCMMNMDLSRLVLVNPPCDPRNEAKKLAAGADEIIKQANVFSTLAEAIAGNHLVIGTSRHFGRLRKNVRSPREMAASVAPMLSENTVAVVFGNEINGLDRNDLALCQEFIAIPSSEAFPSLNLSHAVMIVAYELFVAAKETALPAGRVLAATEDLEQFYHHLKDTLQTIGFLSENHPERMMFSLRQIFGRARLDSRDVKIMRGILSTVRRMHFKQK